MNPIQPADIAQYLSIDLAWRYKAIPYEVTGNQLTLLMDASMYDEALAGELETITGYEITLVREKQEKVEQLLSRLYKKSSSPDVQQGMGTDDFLAKIIFEARDLHCSDIHIEIYAEKCRVRLRIDGRLVERYSIPRNEYASFINKIKIRAKLDIAEKRLPQDGRILFQNGADKVDIRVSVLPTLHGEKAVLRLLNNDAAHISLDSLGLDGQQLADFTKALKKPHGLILISGPTGSGKTTTLYATLKMLNNEFSNILTIEDPIEYTLEGINQVQLKENIGLGFSSALRTFLRQNPDIIMLGEIRDNETAQMAVRAALTGHLVLSTIHTNSAWGTMSRLIDMGVPAFLLAGTVNMTIAQRLLRKLCVHCSQQLPVDDTLRREVPELEKIEQHKMGTGCDKCYYTGYSGRIAIYEIIPIDNMLADRLREGILQVEELLQQRKIVSLKNRALQLVADGITSVDEAYPVFLNY